MPKKEDLIVPKLFALIIILLFVMCFITCLVIYKVNFKEHVIGYEMHEMIRASDSSHYMDTVGLVYRKGDSIFIKDKPGEYNFKFR